MDIKVSECGVTSKAEKPPPLPIFVKIAYSVGHMQNDLYSSMWFTYLLLYYQLVMGLSNSQAGILMLVGQVSDAVATPFIGIGSDKKLFPWKFGRRKSWHLLGTICITVTFPFLFTTCLGCETSSSLVKLIYFSAFIMVFQFGWAAVQVAHLALIPDLTTNPSERTELNAYRNAVTVMSSICVYVLTWAVFGMTSGSRLIGPADVDLFRNIALIVTSVGVVASIVFHAGVKEPVFHKNSSNPEIVLSETGELKKDTTPEVKYMVWKSWFKVAPFYQVGIIYTCTRLFVNLSQTYIPFYLQETLQTDKSSIARIPLAIYISGFFASFFMKISNKKFGRKATYTLGAIVGLGACFWILFGNGPLYAEIQLYFVAVLIGVGGSTILVTCLSMTSDVIGNHANSGAFVFGAMSFVDKLANGIIIIIIQHSHPSLEDVDPYYSYILSFGCGLPVIVALLTLATFGRRPIGLQSPPETNNNVTSENGLSCVAMKTEHSNENTGYTNDAEVTVM